MIILIILIIVLLLSFLFINKTLKKKETILEEVKLQENTIKNDGFALMLQQEDGTYKESTSSSWPTDMVFNAELSGCIDTDGNKIENSLSFDKVNNVVNVSVGKTAYCYVYFDVNSSISGLCSSGSSLGSCISNNHIKIENLSNEEVSGMYRYTGTNPNNYICFGTNDKDTCVNDKDKYMYQIIGVTSESDSNLGLTSNQIKIIKSSKVSDYQWHTNSTSYVTWESSTMYSYLQGTNVLENSNVIPSGWKNKISSVKWYIGDVFSDPSSITSIVSNEKNSITTSKSKIGLMYLSDYYYAVNGTGNKSCVYTSTNTNSCYSWMTDGGNTTWMMSRYGYIDGKYDAYLADEFGAINYTSNDAYAAVRPVFYLNSSEKYVSGEGTKEDPIMLVDDQAPTITSLYYYDNTSPKPYLKITTNEDATYCINANSSASNFDNCVLQGSLKANTETSTGYFTTSGTYYLHVKDADGNSNVEQLGWIEVSIYIGDYILKYEPSGFYAAMEGGLYRFKGTVDDVYNYICYGTSSKSECLNDTDKYMYRIIGINSSKQLKLIKNEALNTKYQWNSTYTSLVIWPNSTIYGTITGSSYLTGNTYMDSSWKLKIVSTNWKYGTLTTHNATASSIYSSENSWTSTQTSQVGLMYLSDYYYSYQIGGLNCAYGQDYSKCKNSWLHISNCDSSAPSTSEWTMSQRGNDGSGSYAGYTIGSGGYSAETYYAGSYSIRPVFYIEYAINYFGGIGTTEDPFRLY